MPNTTSSSSMPAMDSLLISQLQSIVDVAKELNFVPILATGLAAFSAYRLLHATLFSPLRKVPGPFIARLTSKRGHVNNFSGQVAVQVQKDSERYGDVYVFKPNAVCINNPADVRTVLGSQDFCKADFFDVFDDGAVKNIVSQRDPALASRRRRQIGPYLNYAYLNKMEPVIQRHGFQALQAKWDRLIDESKGEPTEVNYRIDTQLVTFDIMSALAFGRDPDSITHGSSSITKWSAIIMDLLDYSAVLALLSLLPFSLIMRPWKSMYRDLALYSKDAVATRKELLKTGAAEVPADMLQAFIEAEDPDSKVKMSAPEVQAECIMMMLAGSETTSSAIMWVFHLLLLHPDKLRIAVEEVRAAFDLNHLILHREVLARLPFIEACVYEALRVSPTTAGVTPRISHTRGIELQNHYIPPGTEIYVNLRSPNMSPDIWETPERFQPERFIGNDEAKKNLFTFSYGPRNCIGRNLAWVEMLTIVANILKNYDIALAPGSPFGPGNLGGNGEPELLPAKCFIASFPANAERDCRMLITGRK